MKQAIDNTATHRQLVRLAHLVMNEHPSEQDTGELLEQLKRACARARLWYRNTGDVARALDSAVWQRRRGA